MIDDSIREKCIGELANRHGGQVSRRFVTMLENRELSTGKALTDEEIQKLEMQFDTEIYWELIGKRGK